MSVKILTFLSATVLSILLILTVVNMVKKGHHAAESGTYVPKGTDKELIDKWKAQKFVNLSDTAALKQSIGAFKRDIEVPLDSEQQQALTGAVVDFITAFHTGTPEDFIKFRFPVKGEVAPPIAKSMVDNLKIPPETIRDSPDVAFKIWWERYVQDKYAGLWTGLSIANCEIHVEKTSIRTNYWEYILNDASPTLTFTSLANTELLVENLKSSSDLSSFLRTNLSAATLKQVFDFDYQKNKDWTAPSKVLLANLNRIIQSNSIYQEKWFANIKISEATSKLLAQHPKGLELVRLNRLLLADAYPDAIRPMARVEMVGTYLWSGPSVTLEPSREDVFSSAGFVEEATVILLPKLRDDFVSTPVYLFLYWSPGDKKWLPERLVRMSSIGDNLCGPVLMF